MQNKFTQNLLFIIALILLVLIGFIILFIFDTSFSAFRYNPFHSSKINILVIGVDSAANSVSRADTIILASIDLKTSEIGALSIPRDTRLEIPDRGLNRVNAAYAFGGIDLTKRALENFLNIPIDYFLETDFAGFARIVDTLGGVTIDIETDMNYVDEAGDLYINLPAGTRKLNGEEALQYVRYREKLYGDIGRVKRQQKFIMAMVQKVLRADIIFKIPALLQDVNNAINTNIPLQDIRPFIQIFRRMDLNKIETAIVPGKPKYINNASYWIADQDKLKIVVDTLIRSKEYINNRDYQISLFNGNGQIGIANELAQILERYGFEISRIANADHFNYPVTIIKFFNINDKELARNLQKLIGGKVEYVEKVAEKQIEIIIGRDFLSKI